MQNAVFSFAKPVNEEVMSYRPGSPERVALEAALKEVKKWTSIPVIINNEEIFTGGFGQLRLPHELSFDLGSYAKVRTEDVNHAIVAAQAAKRDWENTSWDERAAVLLRIAELLSTKYRALMTAAIMLGQSKNVYQAEIDVCELIDFLRFNSYYASKLYAEQPFSTAGQLNRVEYRPLEGFVYAITPFNFTSIASNLNMAPVLMGNTTIWKPSSTSVLSNWLLMKVFIEAGLPNGVVNFLPGNGSVVSQVALLNKDFNAIHFTGSTNTFKRLSQQTYGNLNYYRAYPRLVGETGGKDFIFVHKSADPQEVAVAIVRGAFEYQGQKCSAASRAYIPASMWEDVKKRIGDMWESIKMGSVEEFTNYVNAVIDEASFDKCKVYIDHAKDNPDAEIIFGGNCNKTEGYFVEPTVILAKVPNYESMVEEIFGPIITIYVYDDNKFEEMLDICDQTSPYALTGAFFGYDMKAQKIAYEKLRHAAGNYYVNDKPTGAVVGMQPFGGARASGTNDKAGGLWNLIRWVSPRTIKYTCVPATAYDYPFMQGVFLRKDFFKAHPKGCAFLFFIKNLHTTIVDFYTKISIIKRLYRSFTDDRKEKKIKN